MDQGELAPGKKNARSERRWIVFQDESGFSLTPPIRSTWAPRGKTPVITHKFNWKRVSASAALCYRWDGKRSRVYLATQPGSYNQQSLIGFLKALRRHFYGQRAILLWDGLPAHRSQMMTAYLLTQQHWLAVERLPAYAPELNPVELLWSSLKGSEFANRPESTVEALEAAAHSGVNRVRHQQLAFAFLDHTGLSL